MKGQDLLMAMQTLGVMPSYSRPRVSNDNACAEALFRTAKYCPLWPKRPFDNAQQARQCSRPAAVIGTSENSPMQSKASSPPNKACPVVVRGQDALEVLAFVHPLAGCQLVKGTIEPGEISRDAALRELHEESGLSASTTLADLGTWVSGYENQIWAFHVCDIHGLPDAWTFRTTDDGGHDFKFFWHPLSQQPSEQWHWVFQGALKYIASKLSAGHS